MPTPALTRPVTVVVPVYGDLESLMDCIESLKTNVDLTRHRVLLMNDVGPEADVIEEALLAAIEGVAGFEYSRNTENLGFVGNCNRAATEVDTTDNDILLLNSDTVTTPGFVDELADVLHLSPRHGVVCPRSNNATIASIPFRLRDKAGARTMERSAAVHEAVAAHLPRFSISPVSMGFCFLIRRELIREHGLFDAVYAPGYGEENDFCLRVNEFGYSSLIAHHAIVFHAGAKSFLGARRAALRSAHEKILVSRYPFYTEAVQTYLRQDADPVDVFADCFVPADDVLRVVVDVDIDGAATVDDRTRSVVRAALELAERSPGRLHFTISVPDSQRDPLTREFTGIRLTAHSRLDGVFDLAVVVRGDVSAAQLARVNRVSPRLAVPVESLDGVRSWSTRDSDKMLRHRQADVLRAAQAIVVLGPPSLTADLRSLATADGVDLTDDLVELPAFDATAFLEAAVTTAGSRPVDIARLRRRWSTVARDQALLGTAPDRAVEPVLHRAVRRAEGIAPVPVALARRAAVGLLRRIRG